MLLIHNLFHQFLLFAYFIHLTIHLSIHPSIRLSIHYMFVKHPPLKSS